MKILRDLLIVAVLFGVGATAVFAWWGPPFVKGVSAKAEESAPVIECVSRKELFDAFRQRDASISVMITAIKELQGLVLPRTVPDRKK